MGNFVQDSWIKPNLPNGRICPPAARDITYCPVGNRLYLKDDGTFEMNFFVQNIFPYEDLFVKSQFCGEGRPAPGYRCSCCLVPFSGLRTEGPGNTTVTDLPLDERNPISTISYTVKLGTCHQVPKKGGLRLRLRFSVEARNENGVDHPVASDIMRVYISRKPGRDYVYGKK